MEEPGRRDMVSNFIFIGTRKVGGRKNPMVIWAFDVKEVLQFWRSALENKPGMQSHVVGWIEQLQNKRSV